MVTVSILDENCWNADGQMSRAPSHAEIWSLFYYHFTLRLIIGVGTSFGRLCVCLCFFNNAFLNLSAVWQSSCGLLKLLQFQGLENFSTWAHLYCLWPLSPNNRVENLQQRLYGSQSLKYLFLSCTEKACWNFLLFFKKKGYLSFKGKNYTC